jgi:hypothetical protein
MLAFAMAHEVITLIVVLSLIWAVERAVTAIANRHKPIVECPCCKTGDDDDGADEEE